MPAAPLLRIQPVAIIPTEAGCAVFMGHQEGGKVILFYTEHSIGTAINTAMRGIKPPRPLSHDLFHNTLLSFGAEMREMTILKVIDEVFYAQITLVVENETMEKTIVQVDSRPSDAVALAVRQNAPMYIVKSVWDELKDQKTLLDDMHNS